MSNPRPSPQDFFFPQQSNPNTTPATLGPHMTTNRPINVYHTGQGNDKPASLFPAPAFLMAPITPHNTFNGSRGQHTSPLSPTGLRPLDNESGTPNLFRVQSGAVVGSGLSNQPALEVIIQPHTEIQTPNPAASRSNNSCHSCKQSRLKLQSLPVPRILISCTNPDVPKRRSTATTTTSTAKLVPCRKSFCLKCLEDELPDLLPSEYPHPNPKPQIGTDTGAIFDHQHDQHEDALPPPPRLPLASWLCPHCHDLCPCLSCAAHRAKRDARANPTNIFADGLHAPQLVPLPRKLAKVSPINEANDDGEIKDGQSANSHSHSRSNNNEDGQASLRSSAMVDGDDNNDDSRTTPTTTPKPRSEHTPPSTEISDPVAPHDVGDSTQPTTKSGRRKGTPKGTKGTKEYRQLFQVVFASTESTLGPTRARTAAASRHTKGSAKPLHAFDAPISTSPTTTTKASRKPKTYSRPSTHPLSKPPSSPPLINLPNPPQHTLMLAQNDMSDDPNTNTPRASQTTIVSTASSPTTTTSTATTTSNTTTTARAPNYAPLPLIDTSGSLPFYRTLSVLQPHLVASTPPPTSIITTTAQPPTQPSAVAPSTFSRLSRAPHPTLDQMRNTTPPHNTTPPPHTSTSPQTTTLGPALSTRRQSQRQRLKQFPQAHEEHQLENDVKTRQHGEKGDGEKSDGNSQNHIAPANSALPPLNLSPHSSFQQQQFLQPLPHPQPPQPSAQHQQQLNTFPSASQQSGFRFNFKYPSLHPHSASPVSSSSSSSSSSSQVASSRMLSPHGLTALPSTKSTLSNNSSSSSSSYIHSSSVQSNIHNTTTNPSPNQSFNLNSAPNSFIQPHFSAPSHALTSNHTLLTPLPQASHFQHLVIPTAPGHSHPHLQRDSPPSLAYPHTNPTHIPSRQASFTNPTSSSSAPFNHPGTLWRHHQHRHHPHLDEQQCLQQQQEQPQPQPHTTSAPNFTNSLSLPFPPSNSALSFSSSTSIGGLSLAPHSRTNHAPLPPSNSLSSTISTGGGSALNRHSPNGFQSNVNPLPANNHFQLFPPQHQSPATIPAPPLSNSLTQISSPLPTMFPPSTNPNPHANNSPWASMPSSQQQQRDLENADHPASRP